MSIAPGNKVLNAVLAAALVTVLSACADGSPADIEATTHDQTDDNPNRDTIWGAGGVSIFGDEEKDSGGGALGVNSFLWRATLDTIAFMPVSTADPFGGVILTDWHSTEEAPNEPVQAERLYPGPHAPRRWHSGCRYSAKPRIPVVNGVIPPCRTQPAPKSKTPF